MKKLKIREQEFWGVKLRENKRFPLLIFMLILLASCAKPQYVNADKLESSIANISGECGILFSTEDICLRTEWVQKPSESTFGEMNLIFIDPIDQTRFLDPTNEPFIVLWMPSMAHGSSPVKVERIDVGRYRVSEIFFTMPGPWDIRYQLKDGSNVVEEKIQKITI